MTSFPPALRVAIVGAGPAGIYAGNLLAGARPGVEIDLLDAREATYTTWDGWLALDAYERHLGETLTHVRERVKVVPREEQVAVSRDGALVR